jgi:hypothetical protein
MRAFAAATGQLWKYRVFVVLFAVAVLMSFGFFSIVWYDNPWNLPFRPTTVAYFATGVVWFAWSAGAIGCPKCGKRPVWHLMYRGGTWSVGGAVGGAVRCPVCGYDPRAASDGPAASASPALARQTRAGGTGRPRPTP